MGPAGLAAPRPGDRQAEQGEPDEEDLTPSHRGAPEAASFVMSGANSASMNSLASCPVMRTHKRATRLRLHGQGVCQRLSAYCFDRHPRSDLLQQAHRVPYA